MLIATIRSLEMQRDRGDGTLGETGFYEHEVHLDKQLINADPDPKGMLLRYIANEVAALSASHGLPLFLWTAEFHPRICSLTNLPKKVDFK